MLILHIVYFFLRVGLKTMFLLKKTVYRSLKKDFILRLNNLSVYHRF
jgi:hypothetical protein